MNGKKEQKGFTNNSAVSMSGVSSNWLHFLRENGKGFRNSQLEPEKEMQETKTPSRPFGERMETSPLLQNQPNSKKKKKNKTLVKGSNKGTDPIVTKVLAMDCEMVADTEDRNMLARVSIVNYKLQCLYDKYVKPTLPIGDYKTSVSGIRECNLQDATDFYVVHTEVKQLIKNKILVGHALSNDFKVLKLRHNKKLIRDTSRYEKFREIANGRSPSLKSLVKTFLDENIQDGEHNSIEDAAAAMKLYIKFRHEWEAALMTNGQPLTTAAL